VERPRLGKAVLARRRVDDEEDLVFLHLGPLFDPSRYCSSARKLNVIGVCRNDQSSFGNVKYVVQDEMSPSLKGT
jgi:hypothetical protein